MRDAARKAAEKEKLASNILGKINGTKVQLKALTEDRTLHIHIGIITVTIDIDSCIMRSVIIVIISSLPSQVPATSELYMLT